MGQMPIDLSRLRPDQIFLEKFTGIANVREIDHSLREQFDPEREMQFRKEK